MKSKLSSKLALAFLTLVILIDFMGMATVVVIFPKLLLGHAGILPSAWADSSKYILMGLLLAIYPLGQIFGASALGKFSDFYGRKNILLLTLIGTLIGFFLSGLSIVLGSITLLFASRLLAGLCAGNVAVAQAGLLDISTPETKAKNIAWGQIAMGSAYIIGPMLGGILSNSAITPWFSLATPFWFFSLVLAGLIAVTAIFFEETNLNPKKEKINLLDSFQQIYVGLTSKNMRQAFVVWLLFVSGWWLFESFMPAFLMQSFGYSTTQIGKVLAFNGALYAAFQYVVVQRLAKNMQPQNMFKFAVIFAGLAIVSLVYVSSTLALYFAMSIFVMAMGFAIPGLITFISNRAASNEQGQTMGIISSIQAVATVLVMAFAGYLDSININISILGGGALVILSGICFISLLKKTSSLAIITEGVTQ